MSTNYIAAYELVEPNAAREHQPINKKVSHTKLCENRRQTQPKTVDTGQPKAIFPGFLNVPSGLPNHRTKPLVVITIVGVLLACTTKVSERESRCTQWSKPAVNNTALRKMMF